MDKKCITQIRFGWSQSADALKNLGYVDKGSSGNVITETKIYILTPYTGGNYRNLLMANGQMFSGHE